MAKSDIEKKRVITGPFTANFVQVFKPRAFEEGEPQFSITMTFEPDDPTIKEMKKCALEAMKEKFGDNQEKWPKKWRRPFQDGNEKPDYPGFAGKVYVKAASKNPPGLVDRNRKKIIDETQFYSGCIARAELIAFAYDTKGNKGVSFSLQNIQKIRDGEPLSGRKAAEDVFDSIDGGDEADDEELDLLEDDEDEEPAPVVKKQGKVAPKPTTKVKTKPAPDDDDEDLFS